MKRVLGIALASMLMLGTMGMTAMAEENNSVKVYVTISDDKGSLVMTQEEVTVTDVDGDGALTINDALYVAHEAKYEGGAEAGYTSYMSDYGMSMSKLWGIENGGSYGYCVNNASALSLVDAVKEGDYINAYAYTDLTAWSDTYSYFDVYITNAEAGAEFTLTLSANGYDSSWNPIVIPVANATITVNGEETEFVTDAEGKVTIALEKGGTYIISATSEEMTLVPPVCTAMIEGEPSDTNITVVVIVAFVAVIAIAGIILLGVKKRK